MLCTDVICAKVVSGGTCVCLGRDLSMELDWLECGVCVWLCICGRGLDVGDVLFLEGGCWGGWSQGPREGGVAGGGLVCGGPRSVRGCDVLTLSHNQLVVYLCVLCAQGPRSPPGYRFVVCLGILCLCFVSLLLLPSVCVWISSPRDPRPSPGLPSEGPGPCPPVPRSRGAVLQPEPLLQRPLIEARFLWASPPPLATSLWVGVGQLLRPLSLRSWGALALGMELHVPDPKRSPHILKQ